MEKATQEKYDGSRLVTLEYYDARESENMKLIMGWFEQFEKSISKNICDKMSEKIDISINNTNSAINGLRQEMQQGFASVNARIDKLESKSVMLPQHNALEKRVEKIENKLKFA